MTGTTKNFMGKLLPDIVRKKLGNRIMATIIVSITLVMSVEIVLDLYFGKKDTIELMETLSLDLATSTYSGIRYPMSVGDSSAVEQVLTDIREKMEGIEVFICDTNQLITWSTHRDKIYTNITDRIEASPRSGKQHVLSLNHYRFHHSFRQLIFSHDINLIRHRILLKQRFNYDTPIRFL